MRGAKEMSLPNITKYCACHERWISWLILDTNEMLFTMRGATCVIVQSHQILRLPRKMTVQNLKEIGWKRVKRHFQCAADPRMIRPWPEHDPSMKPLRLPFQISPNTAPARKVTLALHQILPRKEALIIDPLHAWNVSYNAWSNNCHCPNSPNTAPATKSETCTSPNTAPATKSDTCTSPSTAPATKCDIWAITWLNYYLTELRLDCAVTWEVWLDWAVICLIYDLTELWLDWAVTWLSCDLTELWLDWAVSWLSYDLTELRSHS